MREDGYSDTFAGEAARERRGPRHAAPRKSLLLKLNLPSGKKAFALAAMPTAVFVGMSLTPKLAMADDASDIPYAPGPCVTRSDEASESPEPSTSASPSPSASDSAPAGTDEGKDDEPSGATPTATPSPSATSQAPAADTAQDETAAEAKSVAAPTPSATKSTNPLDPLGVGDAIKDFFDGLDPNKATPSPSATTQAPAAEETGSASGTDEPAGAPTAGSTDAEDTTDAADAATKTAAAEKTEAEIRAAAAEAGQTVEELDEDAKGLDAKKDEDIPDGAKQPFPCPTEDPEALAAAELEPGLPLLPADPWILESSLLTLTGLDYVGIVEVKTADGKVKKVLKFTADSIDIKDLHQKAVGPDGTTTHVQARAGSTSTIRNGQVTMYTEELKGNLFGIIPITFSPTAPPPINVPFAFFTNVKVTQAGQFGGSLKVPGLHNYLTQNAG
ncbi:hypothetical protein OHT52_07565 [Streptomyces sp. NBC_00247]|uniref:hypothetical protein n=1 Tax=Streptomyces sp. NBC_00247 TaxID=2975689 RepID=UPI002E28161C|nr:hypothetical protein [Streptomyces sp. NBC_00247]